MKNIKFKFIIFIILLLQLIPFFLDTLDMFGATLSWLEVLLLAISQGIIVCSMKLIKQDKITIKDTFSGLFRYKE